MSKRRINQEGFTIMELVIATSVFGVMLLLVTTGILQIGRAYHKGITTAKTQEVARGIEGELSSVFQSAGNSNLGPRVLEPAPSGYPDKIRAYCIGDNRYSYVTNAKSSTTSSNSLPFTSTHVLWFDIKPSAAACVPADVSKENPSTQTTWAGYQVDATKSGQFRDLLADNMRLTTFELTDVAGTGMKVNLRVLYGDDDVVAGDGSCKSNRDGGQFCAFSELETFIVKR